jgi:hypothetical protein
MDGTGNAIAVWRQSAGPSDLWGRRYVVGFGWETGGPQLVETDDENSIINICDVAMGGAGHAIVVWLQTDGTRSNVWARRYVAGEWEAGGPQLLEIDNTGDALNPKVAMDEKGNAIAVWSQHDGTRYNIWARRYSPGWDWGASPELIETDDGNAGSPQIAMDAAGNAIAVWLQSDGTVNNVWASEYR